MPNGSPERTFQAKLIPGWIVAFYGLLLALQGIFGFGIRWANGVIERATKPVAGFTLDRTTAPNPALKDDKGRRLIRYEIQNPGPGEISGYYLKIKVPGRYDAVAGNFDSKIEVERCGACDFECKPDGRFTIIEVPKQTGTTLPPMAVNRHIGILIDAPDAQWRPQEVALVLPDSSEVPAETAMPSPAWTRTAWDDVRDAGPWLVMAIAFLQILSIVPIKRWLGRRIEEEVERGALENESRGYNKGQRDAQVDVDKGPDITGIEQPGSAPQKQPGAPHIPVEKNPTRSV